ncbi:translocation/assembly module TamB domain-containing protein [Hyphomonas pacifica]|uniref:Translocation and assembly module TamB C-terminal domain-containing protein n=1 Tax=Hyphomonas pacifica TaxID=1280941 RepID=A0A062U4H5_9PROT|nr:translocation/assembly module TamB domain-containing protein [Hyphomonas pacifica]KCZ51539.1 hypothetical protein HY2_11055 [Hyphomonas pacifica]RAN34121.1 hypothetical protein HY3_11185 [Hyphomonas pacifica]
MPGARPFLSFLRKHIWLALVVGILLVLALLIGGARIWTKTDGGRNFVEAQIDGRKVGRVGTIEIEGLSGDPLKDMKVARLTLTDEQGVWLEASDLQLAWSPMALISRKLDLNLVSAEKIHVIRKPVLTPETPSSSSSGNWSVSLADLRIGELRLEEGVAGPKAAFHIEGHLKFPQDRTLTASLDALPLEGAGDKITANLQRRASGAFNIEADIDAPSGGTIATLVGLAQGESANLKASASGTMDEGDGFAVLKIAGDKTAEITAKITSGNLLASANLDASHLPVSDTIKDLVGTAAVLKLDADIQEKRTPFTLTSDFTTGHLKLAGIYKDGKRSRFDGPLDVDLEFFGLKDLANFEAGVAFEGQISEPGESLSANGTAVLTANAGSSLPFDTLEGPLQVFSKGEAVNLTAALTGTGILKNSKTASRLIGKAPNLDVSGSYDRTTGVLTLSPSTAQLARGSLAANGTIDTRQKALNLETQLNQVSGLLASTPELAASGKVGITGTFSAPQINADVNLKGVEAFNRTVAQLVSDTPRLRANVVKAGETYQLQHIAIEGGVLVLNGTGTYGPKGKITLNAGFTQTDTTILSGTEINLSEGKVQIIGQGGVDTISLTSQGGILSRNGVDLTDLETSLRLDNTPAGWTGPITLKGMKGGNAIDITSQLSWADGVFSLQDTQGTYDTVNLSGGLIYGNDSGLNADFVASGERLSFGDRHIGAFNLDISLRREKEDTLAVSASGTINDIWLSQGLRFDTISGQARNAPEGYNFSIEVQRAHDKRPTQLNVLGSASFDGDYPNGQLEMDGTLLGEPIKSQSPITWRLGDAPAVDLNLLVLGGLIEADVEEEKDDSRLTFKINKLSLEPVLAAMGLSAPDAVLSGGGDLYPFGENPRGQFVIAANGPLPGVEETFALDITGRLGNGKLVLNEVSSYGGELKLVSDLTIPINARPGDIARPSLTEPVKGQTVVTGDLAALRSVALAYGHDIGGQIDAKATLTGTLKKPVFEATADIRKGIYEFGTTGMRLTDLSLDAAYKDLQLAIDGKANGADGGSTKFSGTLSRNKNDLGVSFTNLLLYNRDGDTLRAGGEISLTGDETSRDVEGRINIQNARFSLDNLPSSRPQAINVRWVEDASKPEGESKLRQSLSLNLQIDAGRRVFLWGRGLESEWGLDLKLTGTPASPRLNGEATLRRGTLDLAGRPFVFDKGGVTFNGPITRARLDVQADRTVNGFTASVALTGSPTNPKFELSSTPELPQDEILSRLLFGRSSVDLSALEAAQLANSIARLSGKGTGFDPTAELQSALGIDRLSFGTNDSGAAEVGVGQYLADDVYLELNSAGASGSSVEVEWEPRPQISVTSETTTNGEAKVSVKWKKDY